MEHMAQQPLAQLLHQPDGDAGLQGAPHQHQSQERLKSLGEREIPKTGKNGVDDGRARHGGQDPRAASPQG